MVLVAVIYKNNDMLCGNPETIIANGTHSTHQLDIQYTSTLQQITAMFDAVLNQIGIRTTTQLVLGHPTCWPAIVVDKVNKAISACSKISQVVLIDSAVLACYGCARGNALVIEVHSSLYEVTPVLEYKTAAFWTMESEDLLLAVRSVLSNVNIETRSLLADNLIIHGLDGLDETEMVSSLQTSMAAVSAYPSDIQPKAFTARHIPEYHSELLRNAPSINKLVALFGVAISCKSILSEFTK